MRVDMIVISVLLIDFILKENVKILVDWINEGKGPFSKEYVAIWYDRYHQLK